MKLDGDLVFFCWNEFIICEVVKMFIKVIGSLLNEKIVGFFYFMFFMLNILLVLFLICEGVYVDERDNLGCIVFFYVVKKVIISFFFENNVFV